MSHPLHQPPSRPRCTAKPAQGNCRRSPSFVGTQTVMVFLTVMYLCENRDAAN